MDLEKISVAKELEAHYPRLMTLEATDVLRLEVVRILTEFVGAGIGEKHWERVIRNLERIQGLRQLRAYVTNLILAQQGLKV